MERQLIKEKEDRIRAETEAMNAKAERDRLKKQLIDLTQAKTKTEKEMERIAAEQALRDAQAQEQAAKAQAEQRVEKKGQQTIFNNYTAALAAYNSSVSQGIGLAVKRQTLEKILADYDGKGIDMGTVTRELRNLKTEEAKLKKDFDLSMTFYQRLVQQGASKEERRVMLERIIQKYKESGINLSAAEDEIKALK
jgi:hypothetical protein